RPPSDSLAFQIKQIASAQTPADQARAIAEYRIPYRVAASVVKEMSPMVLAALIDVMTPQEVINNLASLKKRGALDNADIKALIDVKLGAAKTDKRVSAYKAKVAITAAEADGELAEALHEVTEAQVKAGGKITRPTALLIDKSGSMTQAIEVGRQLGALASAICEADLFAYAFDTVAYPIEPRGVSLVDWEKALQGIRAGGGTSCGAALEVMRRKRQRVEQIVMVTDEEENTAPLFKDAYATYAADLNVRPAVIFVKIGRASPRLEATCAGLGVAPNVFEFRGDYYALPNVIPLLTYPSLMELVMEVLDYPLPQRKMA
ncbi:MAG TPA: vWA domain-containing protein, partial [Anaerolineae bacterium]|nr:vWA domain-containing protein [Anaerolineae bacterium]